MKKRDTNRIEASARYFDKGFRAIYNKMQNREIEYDEFAAKMNELSVHAQELNRKEIIQAFDMGFKLGVFWHVEISETKEKIERNHGVEYYQNIYEGGEYDQ
jgi:hypothetical protein